MKSTVERIDPSIYAEYLHMEPVFPAMRVPMDRSNRAAQFAPYAALSGFGDQITESERETAQRFTFDEEALRMMDLRLSLLRMQLDTRPEVSAIYYVPDDHKSGGAFTEYTGRVRRIDEYEGRLIFMDPELERDGLSVPLDDLVQLDGEIFSELLW